MKAFASGFKTLYDTGMGPSSGMSEGLGSPVNRGIELSLKSILNLCSSR